MDRSRIRKLFMGGALSLLATLFALLLLEGALRIVKINTLSHIEVIPGKGVINTPGERYIHTKEGHSEGRFNSHGFRDRERSLEKPHGTFRIAVFGDSFVEGLQVDLADTFGARLEKELNEGSAGRAEVLNFGQSGFGTTDEYERYLHFGAEYEPDLVVLGLTLSNDVRNNSRTLNLSSLGYYYSIDRDGELVLDSSLLDEYSKNRGFWKSFVHAVERHSYLASLLSERFYLMKKQRSDSQMKARQVGPASAAAQTAGASAPAMDEFADENIYRPQMSPRWIEAFEITKKVLAKFKAAVEERGGKFVLVLIPAAEEVHPELQEKLNTTYGIRLDYDQPDRLLEGFARDLGITCVNLLPQFREYHSKTHTYLYGFHESISGHWNEAGHALGAKLVAEFLRTERLAPAGRPSE
jgi:hypothetical protein